MAYLLDTNVLLRWMRPDDTHHEAARQAIEALTARRWWKIAVTLVVSGLGAGLVITLPRADAAPQRENRIVRAYMQPAHCNCKDHNQHGWIYAVYADGKRLRVSASSLCSAPQVAPGGHAVGWTVGMHHEYRDLDKPFRNGRTQTSLFCFPAHIAYYRPGHKPSIISPEKIYTMQWKFRDAGTKIAAASRGSHGMTFYQLFNARTGKLLEHTTSAQEGHLPVWAQGLEV